MTYAESIINHIDLILLSLLNTKEDYGYELLNRINNSTGGLFVVKESTMYNALKRLEKYGFIERKKINRRIYYTLTKLGKTYTEKLKSDWFCTKKIVDRIIK